jgi:predicted small secreted protein
MMHYILRKKRDEIGIMFLVSNLNLLGGYMKKIIFLCLSVCLLNACNTTNGMSQDVNKFSDSVHNAVNS